MDQEEIKRRRETLIKMRDLLQESVDVLTKELEAGDKNEQEAYSDGGVAFAIAGMMYAGIATAKQTADKIRLPWDAVISRLKDLGEELMMLALLRKITSFKGVVEGRLDEMVAPIQDAKNVKES
jgi:hypothetical protein